MAWQLLDEGTYRGRVQAWYVGASKEKGTPCVVFEMEITEKEIDGNLVGFVDTESAEPPTRDVKCWLSAAAWPVAKTQLRKVFGYDRGDDKSGLIPDSDGAFDFSGMTALLKVKHEAYSGKPVERIEFKPPPPVRRLNAAQAAALLAAPGREETIVIPSSPAAATGDGIPF